MSGAPGETLSRYLSTRGLRDVATRVAADRRTATIVAVAAVAFALLAIAVLAIWLRPAQYTAEARVVIVPAKTKGDIPVTSLDTLSRGTVVETFAQVLASERVRLAAFRKGRLAPDALEDVKVETSVLSGTAIVRIVATGDSGARAEAVADALADNRLRLAGYTAAFRPLPLVSAAGSAERAGPSRLLLSFALILAAVVNAAFVLVYLRRRSTEPNEPPVEERPLGTAIVLPKREPENPQPPISARR